MRAGRLRLLDAIEQVELITCPPGFCPVSGAGPTNAG